MHTRGKKRVGVSVFKCLPLNETRWMQCRWVQSPQDVGSLSKDFFCLCVYMGWGRGVESLRMRRYWVKVEKNASAKVFTRRLSTEDTRDGNAMVGLRKKTEPLTGTLSRNCNVLSAHHVWCEEVWFPPWSLPNKSTWIASGLKYHT